MLDVVNMIDFRMLHVVMIDCLLYDKCRAAVRADRCFLARIYIKASSAVAADGRYKTYFALIVLIQLAYLPFVYYVCALFTGCSKCLSLFLSLLLFLLHTYIRRFVGEG